MSQSYSSNCFSTANVIETDMQNVENNFDALRSLFSGSSAPTSPDAGQLWYDTGSSSVKIRYNSSWVEWWDMDGQCVAAGQVKTASLAAGVLSTDAAGRKKMANGYITNAHVADVDVTKITNLNKAVVIATAPYQHSTALAGLDPYTEMPARLPICGNNSKVGASFPQGRLYIPNTGASKLKASIIGAAFSTYTMTVSVTVGTSSVVFGTLTAGTTYIDSSTYIDVTAWLGTVQPFSLVLSGGRGRVSAYSVYLTT